MVVQTSAVLFDLDGTLLDSLADIGDSMNLVLSEMGLPTHSSSDYRSYVGEGIRVLAWRALPSTRRDDATLSRCVARMSEVYRGHLADKTRPYHGIPELLDSLDATGIRKAVLSNKPQELTASLVSTLLGRWTFDPVFGERPGVARKPDPTAALEAAGRLGLSPQAIVFVGDTPIDIETARNAGMRSVAAAWGFRSESELREAGASVIARWPRDVLGFVV